LCVGVGGDRTHAVPPEEQGMSAFARGIKRFRYHGEKFRYHKALSMTVICYGKNSRIGDAKSVEV
jgi:hypothetical protein